MQDFKIKIFNELKCLDFVQQKLQELPPDEQQDFRPENLEVLHTDELGQCAVFLRLEDLCAIRDVNGVWRKANIGESLQMKNGVLEGMYQLFTSNIQ